MMGCEIAMVIDPSVGTRIRYIRELNHYTREELAEFAEISSKFLYEIENGQKGLSAANLLKICQALEVSCDYIMTGKVDYKCSEELINILESFDTTQIPNVKENSYSSNRSKQILIWDSSKMKGWRRMVAAFIFLKICDRVKNCKLCQNREK